MRQHVYTTFISNNRPSFHLWCKENLVKHQKVSKYYENDCLQNFIFPFMSLLTAKFVKSSHIWARIYFIFLRDKLEIVLIPNVDLSEKIGRAVTE